MYPRLVGILSFLTTPPRDRLVSDRPLGHTGNGGGVLPSDIAKAEIEKSGLVLRPMPGTRPEGSPTQTNGGIMVTPRPVAAIQAASTPFEKLLVAHREGLIGPDVIAEAHAHAKPVIWEGLSTYTQAYWISHALRERQIASRYP